MLLRPRLKCPQLRCLSKEKLSVRELCKDNPDMQAEEKAKQRGRKSPRPGESGPWVLSPVLPLLVVCGTRPFLWLGLRFGIHKPWLGYVASQPEGGTVTRPSKLQLGRSLANNPQGSSTVIAPDCWALLPRVATIPHHPAQVAQGNHKSNDKSSNSHSIAHPPKALTMPKHDAKHFTGPVPKVGCPRTCPAWSL